MPAPAVLAIVAHPDDIEFYAAGTLLRLRDAGWDLHYLNVSCGDCGSMTTGLEETRRIRTAEGRAAAPTSMDPQFYVIGSNSAMARNMFDGLVNQDAKQRIEPALALSWKVLDGILRLLHPFMPFVTEELWQAIPHDGDTLALAAWPKARKAWFSPEAEREVAFLQDVVVAVRNLRAENKIAPGRAVPVVVRGSESQLDLLERLRGQLLQYAAQLGCLVSCHPDLLARHVSTTTQP